MVLGLASPTTTYEGQTAIRLEAAARRHVPGTMTPTLTFQTVERDGLLWVDWAEALATLISRADRDADGWAYAAHAAIAEAAARMAAYGADQCDRRDIVLSGGVFMNRILTALLMPRLEALGLTVRLHGATPPNDGCIALGQAVVAGG